MGNQFARTAVRTVIDPAAHPAERNDRWLTPASVVAALGKFDLDPCGAPDHPLAEHTYLLENGDDGLDDPWFGRVWLNPPYGRMMRDWVERMVEHGTGTALLPVATGTKLWQDVVFREASAIHFYRHRIKFLRRDGKDDDMVSPQASGIIAFGEADAEALRTSGLPGVVLELK
jgi:DNA N-6-adenine-methyltransferase (Dam)